MQNMVRKIGSVGNTILHMVAKKSKDYVPEKMVGSALVLQEELLWYQVQFHYPNYWISIMHASPMLHLRLWCFYYTLKVKLKK